MIDKPFCIGGMVERSSTMIIITHIISQIRIHNMLNSFEPAGNIIIINEPHRIDKLSILFSIVHTTRKKRRDRE